MKTYSKTLFIFENSLASNKIDIIKKYSDTTYVIDKKLREDNYANIMHKLFVEKINDVIIMFGRSKFSVDKANKLKNKLITTNKNIYVFDWTQPLYQRFGKFFFLHEKIQNINDITNLQLRYFSRRGLITNLNKEAYFKVDAC